MKKVIPVIILIFSWAVPGMAFEQFLNGYFNMSLLSDRKTSMSWDLLHDWESMGRFEVQYKCMPLSGVESYINLYAETALHSANLLFNRAYLKFNRLKNTDLFFYVRDEHQWINSPLLNLVDLNVVKDDNWGPKAEGCRFEFWDQKGFYGTVMINRLLSENSMDYVFRLGKKIDSLSVTMLYVNKDGTWNNKKQFNDVGSVLLELPFLGMKSTFEAACSRSYTETGVSPAGAYAAELEVRDIKLAALTGRVSLFKYGPDFRDDLSYRFNADKEPEFDRTGAKAEVFYDFPDLSVSWKAATRYYRTTYDNSVLFPVPFNVWKNYTELYVEFVNNVNFRTFFDSYMWNELFYNSYFAELSAGSRLGSVKVQFKIKDIGMNARSDTVYSSLGQRDLLGLEIKINILKNLSLLGREVMCAAGPGNWSSSFLQLAYMDFRNIGIFLEYGEQSYSDNDLVNDNDFADNYTLQKSERVKLFMTYNF